MPEDVAERPHWTLEPDRCGECGTILAPIDRMWVEEFCDACTEKYGYT